MIHMYFLDSIYPAWVLNSLTADRVKDQEKIVLMEKCFLFVSVSYSS